jgi:hypothetical protein
MFGLCQGERSNTKKKLRKPLFKGTQTSNGGGGCCAAAREIKIKNDYTKPEEYVSRF